MIGDAPNHGNNDIVYNNVLSYSGGMTSAWTDDHTTSDTLVNCMATNMALQTNVPYEKLTGKITSKLINFITTIQETNHSDYLYFFNRATLDDKEGMWDVEIVELASEFNIHTEDSEQIESEAADHLITQ